MNPLLHKVLSYNFVDPNNRKYHALAGGTVGGGLGYLLTKDKKNKIRNALLGATAGAGAGIVAPVIAQKAIGRVVTNLVKPSTYSSEFAFEPIRNAGLDENGNFSRLRQIKNVLKSVITDKPLYDINETRPTLMETDLKNVIINAANLDTEKTRMVNPISKKFAENLLSKYRDPLSEGDVITVPSPEYSKLVDTLARATGDPEEIHKLLDKPDFNKKVMNTYLGGYSGAGRELPYRKMFGLSPRNNADELYVENADGSFSPNLKNKEQRDDYEWMQRMFDTDRSNKDKVLVKSMVGGNVHLDRKTGRGVDVWDIKPLKSENENQINKSDTGFNLLRAIISMFTNDVNIKYKVNPKSKEVSK